MSDKIPVCMGKHAGPMDDEGKCEWCGMGGKPFETGTTVVTCPVDDCTWMHRQPQFDVPERVLANVFPPGTMTKQAIDQANYELEQKVREHNKTHTAEDFLRTIARLRTHVAQVISASSTHLEAVIAEAVEGELKHYSAHKLTPKWADSQEIGDYLRKIDRFK